MKLGNLVVLPEKKDLSGMEVIFGVGSPDVCIGLGRNEAISEISQIEIPIAKILELVEVDVGKIETLLLDNTPYPLRDKWTIKAQAKAIADNKKDILKAVKP